MKNTSTLVRTICEIGIIAALGFVFDELQGLFFKGIFLNGGSIGFAMIAVLVIAFRRGWLPAFITGIIMGALDLATSAYIIHPVQLVLDYILPYAVVGFAGLLKPFFDKSTKKEEKVLWLISGAVIGGLLKFLSHYTAGVFFWTKDPSKFLWGLENTNRFFYCFVYNIAFIGPSIILTGGLLVAMFFTAPRILSNQPFVEDNESEKKSKLPVVLSSIVTAGGLFCFVYYLIEYIKSFSDYYVPEESAYGYDFNPDSMVIFVLGLFIVVLGVNCIIGYFKNNFSYLIMSSSLLAITGTSLLYGIVRLIRAYIKEKDPKLYWIWFVIGTLTVLLITAFFIVSLISKKREKTNSLTNQ